ncbi:MAG: hypothetical protein IJZ79_01960 [Bacilli bacterium]|nr:hypothetical protein [Bacilli bacterium]
MTRQEYVKHYHELGDAMFEHCIIPTVSDFAKAFEDNDEEAMAKITKITKFTNNTDDIIKSVNRRNNNYSEQESKKFMQSVIAANVTDITESGYFYKKLISSCDDMTIEIDDCGSEGVEMQMPIDESTFEYKVRNHWVMELNKYVEDYEDLPKTGTIHVRTFLACNHGIRHFCKKCAGLFRRSYDTEFTPKNIGIYSTLMITEHATQASLDSMNKGTAEKVNVTLESKMEDIKDIMQLKARINEVVDQIGNVGVESRFYEIALLSRWRNGEMSALKSSFCKQPDVLGTFIYTPSKTTFKKLLLANTFEANSMKTRIAFDRYNV